MGALISPLEKTLKNRNSPFSIEHAMKESEQGLIEKYIKYATIFIGLAGAVIIPLKYFSHEKYVLELEARTKGFDLKLAENVPLTFSVSDPKFETVAPTSKKDLLAFAEQDISIKNIARRDVEIIFAYQKFFTGKNNANGLSKIDAYRLNSTNSTYPVEWTQTDCAVSVSESIWQITEYPKGPTSPYIRDHLAECKKYILDIPMKNVRVKTRNCTALRGGMLTGLLRAGEERSTRMSFAFAYNSDTWLGEIVRYYYLSPPSGKPKSGSRCNFIDQNGSLSIENLNCSSFSKEKNDTGVDNPCSGLDIDFWEDRRIFWPQKIMSNDKRSSPMEHRSK